MFLLAGFVDDDDVRFVENNPESGKTKAIFRKVLDDMETAQKEMRCFRIFDSWFSRFANSTKVFYSRNVSQHSSLFTSSRLM